MPSCFLLHLSYHLSIFGMDSRKIQINGDLAQEDADKFTLYSISPDLTCTCDDYHMCQQCHESLTECDFWDGDASHSE